jgi:hypothetical protein
MNSASMYATLLLALVGAATQADAAAFVPAGRAQPPSPALFMAGKDGAIVPVNQETIEFSAGAIGGAGGFFLGGPVLGGITAAATNYLARKEDGGQANEVVRTAASKGIDAYNAITGFVSDQDLGGKAKAALGNASPDAVDALDTIGEKADEIGIGEMVMKALSTAGDAVESLVDGALNAAEENGITDKIQAASSEAMEKAKSAASEATK